MQLSEIWRYQELVKFSVIFSFENYLVTEFFLIILFCLKITPMSVALVGIFKDHVAHSRKKSVSSFGMT